MIWERFKWWALSWVSCAIYRHGFKSRALWQFNRDAYARYEQAAMAREDWLR